jgi:integrase/recombinase XerC
MISRMRRPISGEEEHVLLEFAHFLSGVRSPATVAAYQSDIRLFAENTPGLNLLHISDAQEDDYIVDLQRLGRKRRTITRKGTAFRYFRQFLSRKRLTSESLNPKSEPTLGADCKPAIKLSIFTEENEIDQALSAFMRSVTENRSEATVRAYTCDLLKFHDCLRNTAKWYQVTKQHVSDFLNQQMAALNANSTARLLSTIRSLFRWLQQNGYVIGNPTLSLRVTRGGKSVLLPSIADLDGMVSADIPSEFSALRDRLIFELPYRCGLRASEISSLNVSSVDLKRKRLVIEGSRGRRRYIHLPEFLIGVLVSYLPRRQAMGEDSAAPLVVNLRGGRLTTRSIGRVVGRLAASHKLPEGTHPHTLRHAYASHGLQSGKDVQDIRHALGVSGVSAAVKMSN